MAPEATIDLYSKIVKIFQKRYNAINDADFPEMVIINLPLPDVVKNENIREIVFKKLLEGIKKLENAEVDFIVIPCNTVMTYLKKLQEKTKIPLINFIQEVSKNVKNQGLKKIGLLGTKKTLNSRLYDNELSRIEIIKPNVLEQEKVTKIIMNILSGKKSEKDSKELIKLTQKFKNLGFEKTILGCTDLQLLVKNKNMIDSIQILAETVVKNCVN